MKEKVMVTGGAGFIGSNISEKLLKDGYEVIAVDNISTGRMENIVNLLPNKSFRFYDCDINDIKKMNEVMEDVDYVLHQAAIPSVPRSVKDPIASNHANIDGTLNVLVVARDNNVKKVVFASSSSVYGDTPTLPKNESMASNPLSPYALNKMTGEIYCRLFTELYGLSTISLRYFNVYGPHQDPNSQYAAVIPKFITNISNNESPLIFGDGLQTRDFTFVEDVASANILAMKSKATGQYNIAGGRRISLLDLIDKINSTMGKTIKPKFTSERPGDVKHSLADISKAKDSFGYEPQYSLEEGLRRTIEWFTN